jgi:hypothetical protein
MYVQRGYLVQDLFAEKRGWFESRPKIVIMKVDVKRYEALVLVGAEKLLKKLKRQATNSRSS